MGRLGRLGHLRARWIVALSMALALAVALVPAFMAVHSALASSASITLSPTSGAAGATVQVAGSGYRRSESVSVTFDGAAVATSVANRNGAFSASFTAPQSAQPGNHTVTATGAKSHLAASATFQIISVSHTGDWPQFGYAAQGGRDNVGETTLSPSNVAQLTQDWSFNARGTVASVAVVNGVVYADDGMGVDAINATTGAQLWASSTMGSGATESSDVAPAVANGVVYANGGDNQVYAFDAQTGATLWTFNTHIELISSPTVANGLVYITADSGIIYALNATTGAITWSYLTNISDTIAETPAVANGAVYFVTSRGVAYALNASTGALLWSETVGDNGPPSTAPAYDNGVIYMVTGAAYPSTQGEIIALNATTGVVIWTAFTSFYNMEGLALANGDVYASVVGSGGGVYAFDEATGALKWHDQLAIGNSTPAAANGVIYVGAGTAYAYALDANTGATLATLGNCGIQPYTAPAVAAGVVYAGCATTLNAYHLPGATP